MNNKVVNVSFLMVALLGVITYSPLTRSASSNELALVPAGGQIEEVKTPTMQDAQSLANKIIAQMGGISAAVVAKVREFKDSFISPIMEQFNAAYAKLQQAGRVALEKANAGIEQLKSAQTQLVTKLRSLKEQFDEYKKPVVAVVSSIAQIYNTATEASDAKADLDQTLKIVQRTQKFTPDEKKELLERIVDSTSKINAFVKVFDETVLENLSTLMGDSEKMAAVRGALKGYQDTFDAIQYLVNDEEVNMAALAAQEKRLYQAEIRLKQMAAKQREEQGQEAEEELVGEPEEMEEMAVQRDEPVMSVTSARLGREQAVPINPAAKPYDIEESLRKLEEIRARLGQAGSYGK